MDFAIRKECLRLECLASGGDRWFAGGAGEGQAGAPDGAAAEEGEQRWNQAVLKGGKALFAARAQASKLLEEQKAEIAQAELRPARWVKDGADEEDVMDAEAEGGTKQPQAKRLRLLHEVRLPDGVVDACIICKASIPYVGCCGECAGYRLHVPAGEYWTSLDTEDVDTTGTGAAIGGSSDVVTPQKPRRSSRFQGASGSSGSGPGAVNYDERRAMTRETTRRRVDR